MILKCINVSVLICCLKIIYMIFFYYGKVKICYLKNIFNKKNINIEELLKKYDYLKKSAIEININSDNSVSKSYFGGEPLVDEQFVWPYFMTDYFEDGDFKLRPLTFLLQIDCKDLIEFDKDNLLPHSGILSFFIV